MAPPPKSKKKKSDWGGLGSLVASAGKALEEAAKPKPKPKPSPPPGLKGPVGKPKEEPKTIPRVAQPPPGVSGPTSKRTVKAEKADKERKRRAKVARKQNVILAADLTPGIGDIGDFLRPRPRPPGTAAGIRSAFGADIPTFGTTAQLDALLGEGNWVIEDGEIKKTYRDLGGTSPTKPPIRDTRTYAQREADERDFRYTAALGAPISETARRTLRETRPEGLPDILDPQPGEVVARRLPGETEGAYKKRMMIEQIKRGEDPFQGGYSLTDLGKDIGVNLATAAGLSNPFFIAPTIYHRFLGDETKQTVMDDLVNPAMAATAAWGLKYGGIAGEVLTGQREGLARGGKRKTGGGRGIMGQQMAAGFGPSAEIGKHAARIVKNSIVTGSQMGLGVFPGLVYGALDPKGMATATAEQYELFYGPLLRGDIMLFLDNAEKNPLQIPLDLLTVIQVGAGAVARASLLTKNFKFVGKDLMVENQVTGKLQPVTRKQAIIHSLITRRTPHSPPGVSKTVWGRPPPIRHIEREQMVPIATEKSGLILRNVRTGKQAGGKGLMPKLSAKKEGLVGTHYRNDEGGQNIIRWMDDDWRVEGIYEKREVIQRFTGRSDVARILGDLYWDDIRPDRMGFRQAMRDVVEQDRAVVFGKVQAARAAASWTRHGATLRERRTRRQALTQMLEHGDNASQYTRDEIAVRKGDPEQYQQTTTQKKKIVTLEDSLEYIDNPPAGLRKAHAAIEPIAREAEDLLIALKVLNPETAKQVKRSNAAWLAEGPPLNHPMRTEIEMLFRANNSAENTAVLTDLMDANARAWGEDFGRPPEEWYSETFGAVRAAKEIELMLLSPLHARRGIVLAKVEERAARKEAARAAGLDYPQTAERAGEIGVASLVRRNAEARQTSRGGYLSPVSAEDLAEGNYRVFMSDDESVMFAISGSGDLGFLFSDSKVKGAGRDAILHAIVEGAKTGDAYDGYLPPLYREYGFREVARTKFDRDTAPDNWNHDRDGTPDIVHIAFAPWLDDVPSTRYLSYAEGKTLANSVADGGEGRAFYREFYSKLVDTILSWKEEKIEVASILGRLEKAGIGKDEIAFFKVEEFVRHLSYSGKSVNKGELLKQFNDEDILPAITVEEGTGGPYETWTLPGGREEAGTIFVHWPRRVEEGETMDYWETEEGRAARYEEIQDMAEAMELPEPEIDLWQYEDEMADMDPDDRDEFIQNLYDQAAEDILEADNRWEEAERMWEDDRHYRDDPDISEIHPDVVYKSPHFGDGHGYPENIDLNLLAHARYSIRTIDGVKTMVIEELQSDIANAIREGQSIGGIHASDVPLVKAWPLRMVKEVLAEAEKRGIKRIAWTSGQQQADRYNLFLQRNVQKVEVSKSKYREPAYSSDAYDLRVTKMDGEVIEKQTLSGYELKKHLGKNMHAQIVEQLVRKEDDDSSPALIEGDNLSLGTGLGVFYDDILPKLLMKHLGKEGIKFEEALLDKIPLDLKYHDGLWHVEGTMSDPRVLERPGGSFLYPDDTFMEGVSSASKEALLYSVRRGEAPAQIRQINSFESRAIKTTELTTRQARLREIHTEIQNRLPQAERGGPDGVDARRRIEDLRDEYGNIDREIKEILTAPKEAPIEDVGLPQLRDLQERMREARREIRDEQPRADSDNGSISRDAELKILDLRREIEDIETEIAAIKRHPQGEQTRLEFTEVEMPEYRIAYSGGTLSPERFATRDAAIEALDDMYRPLNGANRVHQFDLELNEMVSPEIDRLVDVVVPYFDLTPEAVTKIQKGQSHFRQRRGVPIAALHITEDGPPTLYLSERADLLTAIHEISHARLPQILQSMHESGDEKLPSVLAELGIEDWENITPDSHELFADVAEVFSYEGKMTFPHLRDMMKTASDAIKSQHTNGLKGIIPDEKRRKAAIKALKNDDLRMVLQYAMDPGKGKAMADNAVFITHHRYFGLAHAGHAMRDFFKAGLTALGKSPVRKGRTLTNLKEGRVEVGADPVLRYAAEALRTKAQFEAAQWVTSQAMEIQIIDGLPYLPDTHAFWRPGETHTTIERMNEMSGESEEMGIEQIREMEPQELAEEMMTRAEIAASKQMGIRVMNVREMELPKQIDRFAQEVGLSKEAALKEIREGKILMAPKESINAYVDAVAGVWTLDKIDGLLAALKIFLMIPNELAKWSMITKPAYSVLNTAGAAALGIIHQGVWMPANMRVISDLLGSANVDVLHYFDSLVGGGSSELGKVSDIRPRGALDAIIKGEQLGFSKALNWVSTPERRLRRTAVMGEFRRYGLTNMDDIRAFRDAARSGDTNAVEMERQIGRLAEESMIRFRGMRPSEQQLVRNFLFVYGWVRAATRFTLRYPVEHPYLARVFGWAGEYGWDQVRQRMEQIPWRYAGAFPVEQITDEDMREYIRMFDLNPILPQATAAEFARAIWNSATDWDVAKDTLADLLSPGAQTGLSIFAGEDNWGNSFLDQVRETYVPWEAYKHYPGIMWIMRFADPKMTETKIRAPTDRLGIFSMFVMGQSALTTYKQEPMYQRWLEDLPLPIKRIIQHQQDAANFRLVADTAYQDQGGLSQTQILAIEAMEAYAVGASYKKSQLAADAKKRNPYIEDDELDDVMTSGYRGWVKYWVLNKTHPGARQTVDDILSGYGYSMRDPSTFDTTDDVDQGEKTVESIIDSYWESNVTSHLSNIRSKLKFMGIKKPRSESFYRDAHADRDFAEAYWQFGGDIEWP